MAQKNFKSYTYDLDHNNIWYGFELYFSDFKHDGERQTWDGNTCKARNGILMCLHGCIKNFELHEHID